MSDLFIFGFGLCVTILVGSALTLLIVQNNRRLDRQESEAVRETTGPRR